MAGLGAALSLLMTGYIFGINNNLFHLPIIERLYDEPQFRGDPFVQSLRHFAAGPFILLEGSARFVSPEILFPLLNVFSRGLTFIGLLLCAWHLNVRSRAARFIFVVLISFTPLMRGYSYAGGGGLFINIFTHSEIANGLLLIALALAIDGRIAAAFIVNGLVFFTNAFMGVWNAVPLALIAGLCVRNRRMTLRQAFRQGLLGLLGFAVLALPVLWNIGANPEFGRPISFDYPTFLREYWPYHFLFGTTPLHQRFRLAFLVLVGSISLIAFGQRGRLLLVALWAFVIVYCIGIVAPGLTSSPTVLNLHLLRSGVGIHLLVCLASVSLATTWLLDPNPRFSAVLGPLLALSFCSISTAVAAAPLLIAAGLIPGVLRRVPSGLLPWRPAIVGATAVVLAASWGIQIVGTRRVDAPMVANARDWRTIGDWARSSTDPSTVFMIPTGWLLSPAPDDAIAMGDELFLPVSHRRVWADVKSGAAAMWSPSYYPGWHKRVDAQLALPNLAAKLAFARINDIGFVVDRCVVPSGASSDGADPVFSVHDLCVFAAARGK